MRTFWTLAATLLLAGSMALAQSSGSTASPSPSPTAGQPTVIRGCLKGGSGSYVLSSSGTSYQLSGNTSDLAAHVGHTLELTGTNLSDQNSAATQPNQQSFSVQSVSMISEKCESDVGRTSDTQGMTSAQQSSGEAGGTGSSTQPRNPSDLQSPNHSAAPDNSNVPANNSNATTPPQDQSSMGSGVTGAGAGTSDQSAQNNSSSQPSGATSTTSDMSAAGSNAQSGSKANSSITGNQSADTSQSNPASMNSPTASSTTAQSVTNPTGETAAPSQQGTSAADNTSQQAAAPDNATSGTATTGSANESQTGAAATAPAGTSATETTQGNESAQAGQEKQGGALPQTASPLPLLGLLGFGSLASGLFARFRK